MKVYYKTNKFMIIDDLLPKEQFDNLWVHIQNERYTIPHKDNWLKVWRLTDMNCMGGPSYHLKDKPFKNYMDAVSTYMLAACKSAKEMIGEQDHNWVDASFRPYLYPRGTKLSWHNDAGNYHAALTYYCHPYWGSTWGGELMVAEVPDFKDLKTRPKASPHLDHCWEDEYLAMRGLGQWIFPKPNRLVIMLGGVYHSINRVDPDAGDHVRCSIVTFLNKKEIQTLENSNQCPT